ncbi:hypothetical protein L9F63_015261, partial [Diploptera punctata]
YIDVQFFYFKEEEVSCELSQLFVRQFKNLSENIKEGIFIGSLVRELFKDKPFSEHLKKIKNLGIIQTYRKNASKSEVIMTALLKGCKCWHIVIVIFLLSCKAEVLRISNNSYLTSFKNGIFQDDKSHLDAYAFFDNYIECLLTVNLQTITLVECLLMSAVKCLLMSAVKCLL